MIDKIPTGGLCLTSRNKDDSITLQIGEEAVRDRLTEEWLEQIEKLQCLELGAADGFGDTQEYFLKDDVLDAALEVIEKAATTLATETLTIVNHSNRGVGDKRIELRFVGPKGLYKITRDQAKCKVPQEELASV
jgi:hypothetical protein